MQCAHTITQESTNPSNFFQDSHFNSSRHGIPVFSQYAPIPPHYIHFPNFAFSLNHTLRVGEDVHPFSQTFLSPPRWRLTFFLRFFLFSLFKGVRGCVRKGYNHHHCNTIFPILFLHSLFLSEKKTWYVGGPKYLLTVHPSTHAHTPITSKIISPLQYFDKERHKSFMKNMIDEFSRGNGCEHMVECTHK